MTYEGLAIEGARQIPGFNGLGVINLEDYNATNTTPPHVEGGVFSHVGTLDLDEVDEDDEKWKNKGIREEGNTEDRIQSFENKFEVSGFKTNYVPPIIGTNEEPRDGRGRIIAAKRRGEKKIPVYYYTIIDDSELCRVTSGLVENLRHDPAFKANIESVVIGCLYLISIQELKLSETAVRTYLNTVLKIQNYFAKTSITKIVNGVLARGQEDSFSPLVRVEEREKWVRWCKKANVIIDSKRVFLLACDNESYPWTAWCRHILPAIMENSEPIEIIPYSKKHVPALAKRNIRNYRDELKLCLDASYLMVNKDLTGIKIEMQRAPYICERAIPQLVGDHDTLYDSHQFVDIDKY